MDISYGGSRPLTSLTGVNANAVIIPHPRYMHSSFVSPQLPSTGYQNQDGASELHFAFQINTNTQMYIRGSASSSSMSTLTLSTHCWLQYRTSRYTHQISSSSGHFNLFPSWSASPSNNDGGSSVAGNGYMIMHWTGGYKIGSTSSYNQTMPNFCYWHGWYHYHPSYEPFFFGGALATKNMPTGNGEGPIKGIEIAVQSGATFDYHILG